VTRSDRGDRAAESIAHRQPCLLPCQTQGNASLKPELLDRGDPTRRADLLHRQKEAMRETLVNRSLVPGNLGGACQPGPFTRGLHFDGLDIAQGRYLVPGIAPCFTM